ncbi:MAG: phage portal protein, partial [Prevotella sp.]|nr:phage portal protein [Prevotella sp.]
PEKVIAGTATEDEMVSYYDRTIEPLLIRAAQEMTRKIFSDREFEVGNRIVYNDKKILYMSMKTRLEIFRTAREVGCFTLGTLGDLIGLPVPKGKRNVVVTSQNYNDSLKEEAPKKDKNDDEEDDDTKKNEPGDGNSKVEEEENNAE